MNIIAENQTAAGGSFEVEVNEYATVTIISTGGSADTTIEAQIAGTRWTLLSPITGGVGISVLTGSYSSLRIVPGTGSVVDVSGREKH